MGTGESPAVTAIRRRAQAAIRRRWLYLVVAVVALVVVLVAVPQVKTASTGTTTLQPLPNVGTGTTVGGVACDSGVPQVSWSAYAPPCQGRFTGSNGGDTTRGVTGSTITVSYRAASTAQLAELYAIVPPPVIGTNAEELHTMQAYINAFNKDFELYGRHVVLKTFQGKGDFINEDLGQDQAQAQEDAVTVSTSLKAFADMSLVDSSAVYSTDLAAQQVVTSSLYENAESWYKQYAPWEYTPGPNCTKAAAATAAILGKQLAGKPAEFAGGDLKTQTRKFGIIYPENDQSALCAQQDTSDLQQYGVKTAVSTSVKFDLSQLVSQSDAAVAQMKAGGVTTIILSSADPITPRFLMDAADTDNYHPEWWFQSYFAVGQTDTDALTRLFPADQLAQIMGTGNQAQPYDDQEAVVAYNLGNTQPGMKPIPSFMWTYASLLQFFNALQLAGPHLTPQTFHDAMNRIDTSDAWGMYGGWDGLSGPYDPTSSYRVVKWDPAAISGLDGKPGSFVACDDNKLFSYSDAGSDVTAGAPLNCSAAQGKTPAPPASALHPARSS
jgi:hypothetical protein